ncbi:phage tail protein [Phaeobacter inhibens]|uniref:phage tail protein n=1 Tax=Phaeobacter inhibens TaxID=221822 RepID=UPI000CA0DB48|nr:phage tail protein [Phaeobacter inhibens]AUQ65157.1 phage-related tail protein (gpU) [Phaeobacter inhibens]
MAGPVTMALGPFMFRAHGFGYTGVGRKLDTTWAELETAGLLNTLQWTGPRSETVTINGVLFPRELGGATTLEGVRLAAKSGTPLMLVPLGGKVFGSHASRKRMKTGRFIITTARRDGTPIQSRSSASALAFLFCHC